MDTWVQIATSVMPSLIAILSAYVMIKRSTSTAAIIEKVNDLLAELTENKDMQQRIAMLGQILGYGIKNGIGFKGGRGKTGLMEMIVQSFLPKLLGGQPQEQQQGTNPFAQNQ